MKTYTFYDESHHERPACDCCEGSWMELYNSNDTDSRLGSAHSDYDCYIQAIITEIGWDSIPDDFEQTLWEMSLEELKEEVKNLNIEIEIVS